MPHDVFVKTVILSSVFEREIEITLSGDRTTAWSKLVTHTQRFWMGLYHRHLVV